ncbi:MAG TPA: hypothetical protein VK324_14105 [Tepidisphaeraceae bacterium]|nr:hypothetical protein [Tepidisphaeraceae bacterium]
MFFKSDPQDRTTELQRQLDAEQERERALLRRAEDQPVGQSTPHEERPLFGPPSAMFPETLEMAA